MRTEGFVGYGPGSNQDEDLTEMITEYTKVTLETGVTVNCRVSKPRRDDTGEEDSVREPDASQDPIVVRSSILHRCASVCIVNPDVSRADIRFRFITKRDTRLLETSSALNAQALADHHRRTNVESRSYTVLHHTDDGDATSTIAASDVTWDDTHGTKAVLPIGRSKMRIKYYNQDLDVIAILTIVRQINTSDDPCGDEDSEDHEMPPAHLELSFVHREWESKRLWSNRTGNDSGPGDDDSSDQLTSQIHACCIAALPFANKLVVSSPTRNTR